MMHRLSGVSQVAYQSGSTARKTRLHQETWEGIINPPNELPLGATGKIDKRGLRAHAIERAGAAKPAN